MSYKDEYEVARLHTDEEFHAEIAKRCQRVFHVTDGKLVEGEGHALSL